MVSRKKFITLLLAFPLTVVFIRILQTYFTIRNSTLVALWDGCTSVDSTPTILLSPLRKTRFAELGGVGHWFHLFERLIPQVDGSFENIWSQNLFGKRKKILILMEPSGDSLNDLDAFGRFLLASILTGGFYEHIVFGYIMNEFNAKNETLMRVQSTSIRPVFDVSLQQNEEDMFVKSFHHYDEKVEQVCIQPLLLVSWNKNIKNRELLFSSNFHFGNFRNAVKRTCDLRSRNKNIKNDISLSEETEVRSNYTRVVSDLSDARGQHARSDLLEETLAFRRDIEIVIYQRDKYRKFVNASNLALSFLEKMSHLQSHQSDTSSTNTTSITSEPKSSTTLLSLILSANSSSSDVSESVSESVAAPYDPHPMLHIRTLVHDQFLGPCILVKYMENADVLVTPHGFQSILLVFQPIDSLFVEVFPFQYRFMRIFDQLVLKAASRMHYLTNKTCVKFSPCRFVSKHQSVDASQQLIGKIDDYVTALLKLKREESNLRSVQRKESKLQSSEGILI